MTVVRTTREATGPTTPLLWLPDLILEHGEDPELVCRSVGLDHRFRKHLLKPFPLSSYAHVIRALDRRLGLDGVGILTVDRLTLTDLPRVSPLLDLSENVEEFLQRVAGALTRMIMPGTETGVRTYGDRCLLYIETPHELLGERRPFMEFLLLNLRCIVRGALGPCWNPSRIFFRHQSASSVAALRQSARGSDLVFSARYDGLELSSSLLSEPIPRRSLDLDTLRRLVRRELIRGRGNIAQTARALGMSQRSLQRRLSERGMSYRQLLLDLRMELARRYLEHPEASIGSIARHLDYGHHSDFTRAFKRHVGSTPMEFRRAQGIET